MSDRDLDEELEAIRTYSKQVYGQVLEPFELLGRYRPDVLVDWMKLRKGIFESQNEKGGLSLREIELISIAVEIIGKKPNPDRHVMRAIEAGATVQQVADVVSVCIVLGGMMSYMVSGQNALKVAENHAKKLGKS